MGRIVEYKIVDDRYSVDVAYAVSALLAEGWELYGELKVWGYSTNPDSRFSQALVRREADEIVGG